MIGEGAGLSGQLNFVQYGWLCRFKEGCGDIRSNALFDTTVLVNLGSRNEVTRYGNYNN